MMTTIEGILSSLLRQPRFNYIILATSLILMAVFGFRDNASALFGFLIFAIIVLILINPGIFEVIKVPGGGEIKTRIQDIAVKAREIEKLSVDIGAVALLAAHDNEGPLPDRQSQIDRLDMLVDCGERLLQRALTEEKFYQDIKRFHCSETLYEYQIYIKRLIDSIISKDENKKKDFSLRWEAVLEQSTRSKDNIVPAELIRNLTNELHLYDRDIVTLIDDYGH